MSSVEPEPCFKIILENGLMRDILPKNLPRDTSKKLIDQFEMFRPLQDMVIDEDQWKVQPHLEECRLSGTATSTWRALIGGEFIKVEVKSYKSGSRIIATHTIVETNNNNNNSNRGESSNSLLSQQQPPQQVGGPAQDSPPGNDLLHSTAYKDMPNDFFGSLTPTPSPILKSPPPQQHFHSAVPNFMQAGGPSTTTTAAPSSSSSIVSIDLNQLEPLLIQAIKGVLEQLANTTTTTTNQPSASPIKQSKHQQQHKK